MSKQKIAFLGPEGSYTELALREFAGSLENIPASSIEEVFAEVCAKNVTAGFVPIENLIQGPVTETLDLLFQNREQISICASHVMEIEHVLAVLEKGTKESSITDVFSHPQALAQCSSFLNKELSHAQLNHAASTSAAIGILKEKKLKTAAVIAAKETAETLGLEVLRTSISNSTGNKTRFILISSKDNQAELLKNLSLEDPENAVTSVAINPGRDRKGLLFEILEVISIDHRVNLLSIHSRPDREGGFIFFFDLEGHRNDEKIINCISNLKKYCEQNTQHTAEIIVFGSYKRLPFIELPFKTVGVIGGKGRMGSWFVRILEQTGLEVLVCDRDTVLDVKATCEKSDVVLLSVPMSVAKDVAKEVSQHISPGKLVVENCSIKNSILPDLCKSVSKGVEVLGVHTMFASDIESLQGENIIITKTDSSATKARGFEDFLYKHGARISHAGGTEHDKILSFNQSLIHLVLVSLAEVLRENIPDKKAQDEFSTPNSRNVMQSVNRILNQTDELLVDMQMLNSEAKEMRTEFLKSIESLVKSLNDGDSKKFLESVVKSREFLG